MSDTGIPPLPTDAQGAFAPDVPPTANYTAQQELQDTLDWSKGKAEDIGKYLKGVFDSSHILEDLVGVFITGWAWYCKVLLEWESKFDLQIFELELQVMQKILPTAQDHANLLAADMIDALAAALVGTPGTNVNFGGGKLAPAANQFFSKVVNRFSLLGNGIDPSRHGAGLQNQQYLISQVTALALNEWAIDWASQHLGLGVLKDLQPIRHVLDEVVNTRNVVRHANNAAYSFLLTAPLTRDLNRAYPVKNLGLTALAKLYTRGAITQDVYFDKCLDAGLDQMQAQQLILESAKLLSTANVGDLVTHGFVAEPDALQLLQQAGYQEGTAKALLYIETHSRLWSIMERVGNAAVTAWQHKYIDQDRLEQILRQSGFSDEEINLLEIEGEFTKATQPKALTYAQVKDLFVSNIIGIDDVIAFLDAQGYTPTDRNNLVLLDFTELAERQTRLAVLLARDRVQAEQQRVTAAADQTKENTALAAARRNLAAALDDQAKALGQIEGAGGLITLAGL